MARRGAWLGCRGSRVSKFWARRYLIILARHESGGRVMRKLLSSCVGVFCAVAVVGPALADEPPPVKRQRAAAPERVAPQQQQQQQQTKWSGGQVGGSNGASSVNNNFVDPGAFV